MLRIDRTISAYFPFLSSYDADYPCIHRVFEFRTTIGVRGMSDERLLYLVSKYRYELGKTYDEICTILDIKGRGRVASLLKEAEEARIVTISVTPPRAKPLLELEYRLKKRLGLHDCRIVMSDDEGGRLSDYTRDKLGEEGAKYLFPEGVVRTNGSIAISGGATLTSVVAHFEPQERITSLSIYAAAAQGAERVEHSANTLVGTACRLLSHSKAERIEGFPLQVPMVFRAESEKERRELLEQYGVLKTYEQLLDVDVVVTGIGPFDGSSAAAALSERLSEFGFDVETPEELRKVGGVFDILYQIADKGAFPVKCRLNDFVVGIPLEHLKKMKESAENRVIAVAGGKNKVEAIIAARRCYDTLITDEMTAREIDEVDI